MGSAPIRAAPLFRQPAGCPEPGPVPCRSALERSRVGFSAPPETTSSLHPTDVSRETVLPNACRSTRRLAPRQRLRESSRWLPRTVPTLERHGRRERSPARLAFALAPSAPTAACDVHRCDDRGTTAT